MKLARTALASLSLALSVWFLAQALVSFGASLAVKAKYESELQTWAAYHNAQSERWKALTANIELETKRTTVQTELRKIVIAEYKRCRKGKC